MPGRGRGRAERGTGAELARSSSHHHHARSSRGHLRPPGPSNIRIPSPASHACPGVPARGKGQRVPRSGEGQGTTRRPLCRCRWAFLESDFFKPTLLFVMSPRQAPCPRVSHPGPLPLALQPCAFRRGHSRTCHRAARTSDPVNTHSRVAPEPSVSCQPKNPCLARVLQLRGGGGPHPPHPCWARGAARLTGQGRQRAPHLSAWPVPGSPSCRRPWKVVGSVGRRPGRG